MMVSTRGRYALRVMIDLAEHFDGAYIPLKDIVERQGLSRKYAESIMTSLSKGALVDGQQGKSGGYRLNRAPADYKVGEILRLTEGSLAPVSCVDCAAEPCERAEDCRTFPLWDKLNSLINGYLDSVSIAELMKNGNGEMGKNKRLCPFLS